MSESTSKEASTRRKIPFWHYFGEVATEPVLLTLAVVLAYDHFKTVWETSPSPTAFWNRMFGPPTGADMVVLILFLAAFLIWALVVVRRIDRESQRDKELDEKLDEKANRIAQSIDKLTEEIRREREQK